MEEARNLAVQVLQSSIESLPIPRGDRKTWHRIVGIVQSALSSGQHLEINALRGAEAQIALDVMQKALLLIRSIDGDSPCTMAAQKLLRRRLQALASDSHKLPSTMAIAGVTCDRKVLCGLGGYADVYLGSLKQSRVAVKHLRSFNMASRLEKDILEKSFYREVVLWFNLKNRYILPFWGISEDVLPGISMILPWAEHGDVMKYLDDLVFRQGLVGPHFLITVNRCLYETAKGLEYMHNMDVIHGDLRGANVLVKEDGTVQLADFGLCVIGDVGNSLTSLNDVGATAWVAPELIMEPARPTPESDMYSFGCTCVELYTGGSPFPNLTQAQVVAQVIKGKRPERPRGTGRFQGDMNNELWGFLRDLLRPQSRERPSATQVARWLERVVESMGVHCAPLSRPPVV